MSLSIPISIGELYDKYTILLIKKEKITDINKLEHINKEIEYLHPFIKKYNLDNNIIDNLKNINTKLWDIEDNIRIKEYKNEFDNEFIQLARLVYITNDERFRVKNQINNLVNSEIKEMKSYV